MSAPWPETCFHTFPSGITRVACPHSGTVIGYLRQGRHGRWFELHSVGPSGLTRKEAADRLISNPANHLVLSGHQLPGAAFMQLPRLIALCGYPQSGKSTLQRLLAQTYGYQPVDDGRAIRDTCIRWFNLTEWHVTTQEGKASTFTGPDGRQWQVRTAMQDVGLLFERHFGEYATPAAEYPRLNAETRYSFGSVRRYQGNFHKQYGATVIAIVRPGITWDGTDAEWYDPSCIDHSLLNPIGLGDPREGTPEGDAALLAAFTALFTKDANE